MRKDDELHDPTSCLNRAAPDELVFVLLGRDVCAPATIRAWADLRIAQGKNDCDDRQISEARALADRMERERPRPLIDTTNRWMIGRNGAGIVFLRPPSPLSPDEALVAAAYLVALAPDARASFGDVLAAVQRA